MRLDARTMTYDQHKSFMIYDYNGNEIPYCLWLDTDEGCAECAITVPSGYKTEDDILKVTPLRTFDEDNQEWTFHTYMLHTFVLKNVLTDEVIAKV